MISGPISDYYVSHRGVIGDVFTVTSEFTVEPESGAPESVAINIIFHRFGLL